MSSRPVFTQAALLLSPRTAMTDDLGMETYKEARTMPVTIQQRAVLAADAIMSGIEHVYDEDSFVDLYDDVSIEFVYETEREWLDRDPEARGVDLAAFQTLVNVELRSRGFDAYQLVDEPSAPLSRVRSAILAAALELTNDADVDDVKGDEAFLRLAAALDAIDNGKHAYGSRTAASDAQQVLVDAAVASRSI